MKQILLSVGKRHDANLSAAIEEFTARLNREIPTRWLLVKPSGADELTARRTESAAVLELIRTNDFVVLCDERGVQMSSVALSSRYEQWLGRDRRIVFVIGGANGVDTPLFERADVVWSLSKLVFPHQIVRLVLVEQLYRARMISKNHPYHHV